MIDYDNCNYEESLVIKLEAASRDFFEFTPEDEGESLRILGENTEALNEELTNYRKLKADLVNSAPIGEIAKRRIRDAYVPPELREQFDISSIVTAKDLVNFVNLNQAFFRTTFQTEENVIETVTSLDPLSFQPFAAEYPSIAIRLGSGQISSAEVDGLIKENGLDPKLFVAQTKTKRKNIFDLLNSFLAKLGIGAGIMGSFCALVDDVFALAKGVRDLTGNSSQFLGNFTNVLGLVNPKAGEILGSVQQLISLATSAQQASANIGSSLQSAFGALAGPLGIAMQFADVLQAGAGNTSQPTGVIVDWNLPIVSAAILADGAKFTVIIPSTGKPLGDINQDGIMDFNDSTALDAYIANTATPEVRSYVDGVLIPYLNKNAAAFSEYTNIPSASQPGSSMSSVLGNLSTVAGAIGAGPGSGDFGISKIIETITTATSIASAMQSLISGSKPVNIQSLFGQLDTIIQLGQQATEGMFKDFNKTTADYKKTAEDTLKEAENLAVTDKAKAAEISTKNQESLKNNVTPALETSAENSKNLGSRLIGSVNKIRDGIRQLAAVGVLENLDQQLSSVIDQSAAQLKSRIALFSPASIGNGFNINMLSSFGKMAGMIGQASNAASADTTAAMKASATGMIAQSSEKFRQKNKEEVEFVALRLCKLAGEIERMYKDVTAPIEGMTNSFASTDKSLSAVGYPITLRAIEAGALRLDTQARIAAMQQSGTIAANQSSPFITAAGVRTNVPPQGTYPTGVVPPLPDDYEFPSYEDALAGKGGVLYAPGTDSKLSGPAGFIVKPYGGIHPTAMRNLYALARSWGRTITVVSAYRNPLANDKAGGVKDSQHLAGTAFDCDINTYQEQVIFANLAYLAGFKGIGSYLGRNTFVHIDLGPQRDWAQGGFQYYSLSGPPGAKIG